MDKRHIAFTMMAMATLTMDASLAAGPVVQLDITDNDRAILNIQMDGAVFQGSNRLSLDYTRLALDAMMPIGSNTTSATDRIWQDSGTRENEGGTGVPQFDLQPEWGEAELIISCNHADVVVYHWNNGILEEQLITSVATNYCNN